jgi:phosphate acetyltransferase
VEVAREHLADPITVGTMMLRQGEVDGLVCGAAHTTAATVRPALQILGTRPGCRLVSSVFFMCLPDQVVIYGDCAINPQPSAEDLADIAIQSAASARAFGIEPRVAMISFSTGSSGAGTGVDKVAESTRIVRRREPGLAVDGPLQYDAAAIASVGQAKRPGSPVAGQATVFIFPDLDAGNTTYKAVQRSAQVISIGPMLQGLAKPVNDLSRGALVEDIIYTVALTAIQARAAARSLLPPVVVFPAPFGPMMPKSCSDTLPYLAAELRGDCQRPLLHLPGVTPVTRQLLRHCARREPLGGGQEPAAEGNVLAYAGLLHQRLDALDRRDVLAACGIIKRPAGEEVGRALADFGRGA